jgi:predicted nuclease of predicted toxin-antitoxin system
VKLLLDENVPAPMTSIVKTLLRRSHDVKHVNDMPGWSGTKDLRLYDKAMDAGFQIVVTNDARQMNRKLEAAGGQRLVILKGIDPGRDHRYGVRDPAVDPPKFWPQQAA